MKLWIVILSPEVFPGYSSGFGFEVWKLIGPITLEKSRGQIFYSKFKFYVSWGSKFGVVRGYELLMGCSARLIVIIIIIKLFSIFS